MPSCPQGTCDDVKLIREGVAGVQASIDIVLVELQKRPTRHGDEWFEPTDVRIKRVRTKKVAWLGLLVATLAVVPAWYAMIREAARPPVASAAQAR